MSRYLTPLLIAISSLVFSRTSTAADPDAFLKKAKVERGICVLLGDAAELCVPLARRTELTLFVQLAGADEATALRRTVDAAGLLGTRVWIQQGDYRRLHLADNLADVVLAGTTRGVPQPEVLRILRPQGQALVGESVLVKPVPAGTDEWNHPYHAPDNNPQSLDQVARRPFQTHFLAEPWYCPLTQITLISGGRMFKAFGNRSSAKPQEDMLNKLLAMNAYNGTVLWKRDLTEGFMIHRNTMIATPETLFIADDASCKLLDPATGKVRDEIVVPDGLADGRCWKWMALESGVLYALVGEKEAPEVALRGDRIRGAGWPWWKYGDYKYGFGRTLLAVDPATRKILWHHREKELIDGRAVCLKNGRLYFHSDQKFLACLDAKSGTLLWKNSDADLLQALGVPGAAQHPMLGFASTSYLKCGDDALYFAGPQRARLVAASTKDGKLLWHHEGGNVQLVLRKEALYALGEGRINSKESSLKLDPVSGKVLATFSSRDRCTRATGCADSIFTRGGSGGSTAVFDVTSLQPSMGMLSPMRPACTDGVVVAHGHLFWGPWMCACDQTQIGVISLGPKAADDPQAKNAGPRLEVAAASAEVAPSAVGPADWPTYRKDNRRSALSAHEIPKNVHEDWTFAPPAQLTPTAPVAVGGLVFVSGADGSVRALEAGSGKPRWTAYTGGPVKYPPSISQGRAYVGSGDGWLYCFDAGTGRMLWRHRVAPQERTVPVFGTLSSTWPVASGVLVEGGVAYAAAGMFNYDGTHVIAVDALTGKERWRNDSSGAPYARPGDAKASEDAGVSVQGHLLLHGKAIYLPAGNRPTVAAYALADGAFTPAGQGRGKHLYVRGDKVMATGYPLYWRPDDDHFLTALELETPAGVLAISTARVALLGAAADPKQPLWGAAPYHEIAAVAVAKNAVLVTGVNRNKKGVILDRGITALSLADGKEMWRQGLPAAPVAWGLALDAQGRMVVTLVNGQVVAYR